MNKFEVWWNDIPEYGTTNHNTFKLTAVSGDETVFDYGAMDTNGGVVGLSAGYSINSFQVVDISQSGAAPGTSVSIPQGVELMENFDPYSGPALPLFDLAGKQVLWTMDAGGHPILLN